MPRGLVYLQAYTSNNLAGISIYNNTHAVYEYLAQTDHPHFAEWVLPRAKSKALNWDDEYFNKPYIRPHFLADDRIIKFDNPGPSADSLEPFMPQRGKIIIDYVLNQNYLHSAAVKLAMLVRPNRWFQQIEVPVITYYTESSLDDDLPSLRQPASVALLAAAGVVGPVFVMNDYDKEDFELSISQLLTSRTVDKIMEQTFVVPACADLTPIDARFGFYEQQRKQRRADEHKLTLFHGGSLESKRHLPLGASLAQQFAGQLNTVFKTQKTPKTNPFADQGVRLDTGYNHSAYIESLHEGDILWCAVDYEGTGLAYMEAIRSGQIPLVLDTEWIRTRLPADYPFIVKQDELPAALSLLISNFDAIKSEWQPRLIHHLNAWSPPIAAESFHSAVDSVLNPIFQRNCDTASKINPAFTLLKSAASEEPWLTLPSASVAYAAMTKRSDTNFDFRFISPLALRWMLIALGFHDPCSSPDFSLSRVP